ncbi:hypothetical protein ILYODFUR_012972 [Ilyodon furcidens]|uniref:Uncharacterized protein n=1 Tax=Ilyodon furcidens TaxID=33524 RepID=A0ABV0VDI6_9TELE
MLDEKTWLPVSSLWTIWFGLCSDCQVLLHQTRSSISFWSLLWAREEASPKRVPQSQKPEIVQNVLKISIHFNKAPHHNPPCTKLCINTMQSVTFELISVKQAVPRAQFLYHLQFSGIVLAGFLTRFLSLFKLVGFLKPDPVFNHSLYFSRVKLRDLGRLFQRLNAFMVFMI